MKLERKPDKEVIPAHINTFSKVANLKIAEACQYCGKEYFDTKKFEECEENCRREEERKNEDPN